jgi:hypothetical protein
MGRGILGKSLKPRIKYFGRTLEEFRNPIVEHRPSRLKLRAQKPLTKINQRDQAGCITPLGR